MSSIEQQVESRDDRRNSFRRPIFIAGSAVTIEGSRSVVVEDLSVAGARLRGRHLPGVGKQVLVWMEGLDVLGQVAWSKFGERGVMFDNRLEAGEISSVEEPG